MRLEDLILRCLSTDKRYVEAWAELASWASSCRAHSPNQAAAKQFLAWLATAGLATLYRNALSGARPDEVIYMDDEPGRQALCDREQAHLLDVILRDRDLSGSIEAAVESLRIVLTADESIRTERSGRLPPRT